MKFTLDVNPWDVSSRLSRSELIEFICGIDLDVGEIDFTQELITTLFKYLMVDMDKDEIRKFLKSLKELKLD